MKFMIKKKAIYSLIYFGMIFIIGMILTHSEYISTALIIDFWFSIPMALAYFVELLLYKKVTKAIYIIIALVNTIISFIIISIISGYILSKILYIPF